MQFHELQSADCLKYDYKAVCKLSYLSSVRLVYLCLIGLIPYLFTPQINYEVTMWEAKTRSFKWRRCTTVLTCVNGTEGLGLEHFWRRPDSASVIWSNDLPSYCRESMPERWTFKSLAVTLRTTRFNIQKFYMALALRWLFFTDIRTDSDFCFVHQLTGFYNCGWKCLLRGTNWFLI